MLHVRSSVQRRGMKWLQCKTGFFLRQRYAPLFVWTCLGICAFRHASPVQSYLKKKVSDKTRGGGWRGARQLTGSGVLVSLAALVKHKQADSLCCAELQFNRLRRLPLLIQVKSFCFQDLQRPLLVNQRDTPVWLQV